MVWRVVQWTTPVPYFFAIAAIPRSCSVVRDPAGARMRTVAEIGVPLGDNTAFHVNAKLKLHQSY